MKFGITHRLFLAILAAALLSLLSMSLIIQWSINRGFHRFVNDLEQNGLTRLAVVIEEKYSEKGSWDFLRNDPGEWGRILAAALPDETLGPPGGEVSPPPPDRPPDRGPSPDAGPPPPHPPGGIHMRFFLLDEAKRPLVASAEINDHCQLKEIRHHNRIVGYLGLLPRREFSDERQLRFLKEQRSALALAAVSLLLVAGGLSLPLANRLVRPIRTLTEATGRLASGEFAVRVPVTSADELGQLARDFNSLALTLENNEQARRQWVADISHELRTPLAVLRGEIEALQDGIRKATPEAVTSLHGEVLRLSRLVDDLYQLSMSDIGAVTYRKEELDLSEVLGEALDLFRPEFARKSIALRAELPSGREFPLFADRQRLRQLFTNLLENSLKYTDGGGALEVELERRDGHALVHFRDSQPGVAKGELERLFERLYRVEGSRSRISGGAGLGLAICRNIVMAHEGGIEAFPSPLGGVWIRVDLPLTENIS